MLQPDAMERVMNAQTDSMVLLHQLLGALILPPLNFLLLALAGWLLLRRRPVLGRSLLALSVLLAYLLSLPVTAMRLNGWLERYPPLTLAQARSAQAIVVIGGGVKPAPEYDSSVLSGAANQRLQYAAWLSRQTGLPLLVSGGAPLGGEPEAVVMARVLQQHYGLAARWQEPASRTTQENARYSQQLLARNGIHRIVLVTQAWHMPRALPFFEQAGLQVLPGSTGYVRYDGQGLVHWLPSGLAMQETHQALREAVGMLYYTIRQQLES
jgi:uncharacterized SAM-binding protein YcdF (DUF218 family)